jgi:hypothetical protein
MTDHNEVPKAADAFERWWRASKYCQVVEPAFGWKQIAQDGWDAAMSHFAPQPPTEPTRAEDAPHVEPGGERDAVQTDALRSWLWAEIERLMSQAEHWAQNGKPLAVNYRLQKADAYFQIVCALNRKDTRDKIWKAPQHGQPANYPPSEAIYRYRDAEYAVAALRPSRDAVLEEAATRNERQKRVAEWCAAAFGAEHQSSVPQRGLRFLEEAIEAYQALGGDLPQAHKLLDYVFAKEPGELSQELGGVGITVLALAAAAGISADAVEAAELARVLSKPLAWFRARNKVKNDAGFDATAYPSGALKASQS